MVSCHPQIVTVSLLPFPFGGFTFFSYLIVVANTFNTMLDKTDESGHACCAPDFRATTFSFVPLYDVSCGFVINFLSYIEIYPTNQF